MSSACLGVVVVGRGGRVGKCVGDEFECEGESRCIPFNQRCDGEFDCLSGMDETGCWGTARNRRTPRGKTQHTSSKLHVLSLVVCCSCCCLLL